MLQTPNSTVLKLRHGQPYTILGNGMCLRNSLGIPPEIIRESGVQLNRITLDKLTYRSGFNPQYMVLNQLLSPHCSLKSKEQRRNIPGGA